MVIKKVVLVSLLTLGLGASLQALAAGDLVTINNTKLSSTAVINHGACSTALPNGKGITPPDGKPHIIEGTLVKGVCGSHQKDCSADVYMTNHCNAKGELPVASAVFNTSTGATTITMTASGKAANYNLHSESPFHIIMDGGPAAAPRK